MSAIATILTLVKKLVKWDKKLEIYTNGADNNYPEAMERLRNNSVTASMASNVFIQYMIGKGFGTADDLIIGEQRLIDIADDAARDIADNRGVFFHVNYTYDIEKSTKEKSVFVPSDFKVIPFGDCRLGIKDSKEYNGKILVSKHWSEKSDKSSISIIDVFNPDSKIIEAQVKACEGKDLIQKMANYKGQILYFNMDRRFYYPLSRIDAVASECDNEFLCSRYKNVNLRDGFVGKTLIITRTLIENDLIESAATGDIDAVKKLQRQESEVKKFTDTVQKFLGVEEAGGVIHLQVEFAGDKLEDAIMFKRIESDIDDKMFEYSENSAVTKILMAFNNLPVALVKSPDSALLGNSGEALRVAKETYWENVSKEREILVTLLTKLLNLIPGHEKDILSVVPLLQKTVDPDNAQVENAKAQAQLKGSVGGVQALLQIQASVAAGTTEYTAAVKVIEIIYGIDTETAKQMLGTIKIA